MSIQELLTAYLIIGFMLSMGAKIVASYWAQRAAKRLHRSMAQRAIASGVTLPGLAYGLFVVGIIPRPIMPFDMGTRYALFLVGITILVVGCVLQAWGWWRHDRALEANLETRY